MLLIAAPAAAAPSDDTDRLFPRPAALEPAVRFWRSIFTQYGGDQVVVHDAVHLDRVYEVLDFDPDVSASERESETSLEIGRLRALLYRLHEYGSAPEYLTPEERRIYELFANDPSPDRFLTAAEPKRIRGQRGLRERFAEGIRVSRRYLPEMEEIFRDEGLPIQLTRLPLIESCFDVQAHSKVGASGIWQFMPSTGRLYMRVDGLVDERRDPITSTRAAAQFLSHLQERLGAWPVAITAYNHGPEGMARAIRDTGTADIDVIIRVYDGPSFGFASRNFYPEFLAALDVEGNYRSYFGELPVDPPTPTRELPLDRPLGIEAAARLVDAEPAELARLNPALSDVVVSGRRGIPAGYRLRLPETGSVGFEDRLAEYAAEVHVTRVAAPAVVTRDVDVSGSTTHHVRRGQTLSHIAHRYGVSVPSLLRANGLRRPQDLRAGQVLRIPGGEDTERVTRRTHRVRRGQTLSHIAAQYNVSVRTLRTANGIRRPDRLRPGQVLQIPAL